MKQFKLIIACAVALLGAALYAAQEPAAPVFDCPKAACSKKAACTKAADKCTKKAECPKAAKCAKKAECPKAAAKCAKKAACKAYALPACAKLDAANSDSLFASYIDSKGSRYIVYNWEKTATVYSNYLAAKGKLHPGTEMLVVKPIGRSKGYVKCDGSYVVESINPALENSATLCKGMVIAKLKPVAFSHDSMDESVGGAKSLKGGWGETLKGLWQSTGIYDILHQSSADFKNTWTLGLGRVIMTIVALVLIYLAIAKEYEPLLLLPIGFGALLANIPLAGISGPTGLQGLIYNVGINSGVFPLLIFLGVGAMTDFGPLIANPRTALLGGAAQFGIFAALLGALGLSMLNIGIDFDLLDAGSIGIIGGADGPTSIWLTSKLSPKLLGAIAVAAYSYMALVPIIQPPIMKLCTTKAERKIKMTQTRSVSKIEKICFPVLITLLCAMLLPDAAPLIGMLMFGNLMRECGVVERLNQTAQNALINIVTIFLGIAVGSKLSADQFLSLQTLGILLMGAVAFSIATAAGALFARLMNLFSKTKINPLIGSAGVSAVPMAARVANKVGLEEDPSNYLLMHAMGPNVSGVIGSAVAAGVLLNMLKGLL